MEDRYELAVLKPPENTYFLWVKFLSEPYRREHINDCPKELFASALYHTHPNGAINPNTKKLKVLEEIITDLLVHSSADLLEEFESQELPLEYKINLMKKARDKGDNILYYRFVIRTLITDYKFAREVLHLDRDEELEAIHHLSKVRTTNPQILYELGLWKALEENYAEAAYHFTELYKSLPADYVPSANPNKITTLTIDKLKGYLGIIPETMEIEKDESYARELFHYSRELEGKRRVQRDQQENIQVDLEQMAQNIDIIKSKIEVDNLTEQFTVAKKYLKYALFENKGYSSLSRKIFEDVLSRITESELYLWTDCVYYCAVITPLEESPPEKYFDTLKEIIEKFGPPNIKQWTYILALILQSPYLGSFSTRVKSLLPEDLVNVLNFVEKVQVLIVQPEPCSSDFLSDVYLMFLDVIEKIDIKILTIFVESVQVPLVVKQISRWLFTAVRVLKFIHKERQTEADQLYSYFELISFENDFMIDVPTDIDYKIKTGIHDFSKLTRLTKVAIGKTKKLSPGGYNEYFSGNMFLLEEKFHLAVKDYLKAARVIEYPKFYKRLAYSVMKVGALLEGIILYQLTDPEFSAAKVKPILQTVPLQKFLLPFICDVELLELMIEQNRNRDEIVEDLSKLIDSSERHQSGNGSKMRKILLDQFLDLLHFTAQNFRKNKQE